MTAKLSIKDLDLKGKKVLMRVDFNVPLDEQGNIADDSRIQASLPSIQYVIGQGGVLILMSHLGRPKGKRISELSLAPCAKRLGELLKQPVKKAPDCVGDDVARISNTLQPGEILLLENLRFHRAEEHPDEDSSFAKQLAGLADVYVNDAFGTAHRAHSSTVTVAQCFPGKASAGFLLEKEIQFLGSALFNPKRPFYAILGGAKISTKIGVIQSLMRKVDALLIGGGMSFTFFKAQGISIGDSIYEDKFLETAKEILSEAEKQGKRILLPEDVVVADSFSNEAKTQTVSTKEGIPDQFQGVDIGPKTIETYRSCLKDGATVFWNGPLGVFEFPNFAKGTNAIAQTLAKLSAITIVGGGDSIAALKKLSVSEKISHLSTGGGASLEYLEFGQLPGIEALSNATETQIHVRGG